ncbi:MAG: anthranilate synthase component I family protein, partial [Rikenellaceae bacterium]|nr:anthranilate synthase component I family protein [Rikenellaceae bacterium]
MKTKLTAISKSLLADLRPPVGIYLKVRDMYPQSALLESSDYHSSENSFSFIGIEPLARFSVRDGKVTEQYPDGTIEIKPVEGPGLQDLLNDFTASFVVEGDTRAANGLFGYTSYDAVKYFETVDITGTDPQLAGIPEMTYILYRYVVAVNHLRNEMTVTENLTEGTPSGVEELLSVIESRNFPTYGFSPRGEVSSPVTDGEYMAMVGKGISHCMRGDVFQIVLSRRFEQPFIGDDFMVYRALRSVNPSPYLFYFDFGSFRIFGSSPETHVKVEGNKATIDPIAGTIYRTGDDEKDRALARRLAADEKENAEHVMLVDLARNDLSRNASGVAVESYKELQFYSHVIHLVSRVTGEISPGTNR